MHLVANTASLAPASSRPWGRQAGAVWDEGPQLVVAWLRRRVLGDRGGDVEVVLRFGSDRPQGLPRHHPWHHDFLIPEFVGVEADPVNQFGSLGLGSQGVQPSSLRYEQSYQLSMKLGVVFPIRVAAKWTSNWLSRVE